MEGYVTRVIESLGYGANGKRKTLEGNTVTFVLHGLIRRFLTESALVAPAGCVMGFIFPISGATVLSELVGSEGGRNEFGGNIVRGDKWSGLPSAYARPVLGGLQPRQLWPAV